MKARKNKWNGDRYHNRPQRGAILSDRRYSEPGSPPSARDTGLAGQQTLLQTVVDSVSDLIFAKDRQGRFILSNRALREGCGLHAGSRLEDLFAPDLVIAYQDGDHEIFDTGQPVTVDEIIPIHGERRLFQTVKVPWIVGEDICGVIGVSRDITARQAAEDAVRESEILYRSILEASADCIVVMSLEGKLELINEPGCEIMEIGERTIAIGRSWGDFWPKRVRHEFEIGRASCRERVLSHV